MVEKIGHVRNPLTVIAIFAGIAEISGTIVLPFISAENQSTYIWFLMLFPFFLVGVFFFTLHKNPTALYSPSDYKDESNFTTLIRKSTPEEVSLKFTQEAKEIESDIATAEPTASKPEECSAKDERDTTDASSSKTSQNDSEGVPEKNRSFTVAEVFTENSGVLSTLALAEKLAVNRLSKNLALAFQTSIHVDINDKRSITFDGFAINGTIAHAVEVKLFATNYVNAERFHNTIVNAAAAKKALVNRGTITEFVLHLFLVTDASSEQVKQTASELYAHGYALGISVSVHAERMVNLANDLTNYG